MMGTAGRGNMPVGQTKSAEFTTQGGTLKIVQNQTVLATMSDLEDLLSGKTQVSSYAKKHVDNARKYVDSWYEDPDRAPTEDRLMGKFKYAQDLMDAIRLNVSTRNIISLQPCVEWGQYDGTEVDFEQYMRHDPRCMGRVNMPEAENGERVVRVCLGVGGNCLVDSKELVKRAAKVMKVVKEYEDAGYAVEVFSMFAGLKHDYKEFCNVLIDCSGSSSGQITSAMCSTKIFRTLVFAYISMIPGVNQSDLGYPVNHSQNKHEIPRLTRHIKEILGEHTIVIHADASEAQIEEALK